MVNNNSSRPALREIFDRRYTQAGNVASAWNFSGAPLREKRGMPCAHGWEWKTARIDASSILSPPLISRPRRPAGPTSRRPSGPRRPDVPSSILFPPDVPLAPVVGRSPGRPPPIPSFCERRPIYQPLSSPLFGFFPRSARRDNCGFVFYNIFGYRGSVISYCKNPRVARFSSISPHRP